MSIFVNASQPDFIRRTLITLAVGVLLLPGPVAGQERAVPPEGGPWLGLGLICAHCEPSGPWWDADVPVLKEPPRIHLIDPGGPAARAGLREGDILLEIGGQPIISDAGWQRLREATLGDTLSITFIRNGQNRRTGLEVGWHKRARRDPGAAEPSSQPMRFAGSLAGVNIVVMGSPRVTVREEEGIVVIVTPDATIRLVAPRPAGGGGS